MMRYESYSQFLVTDGKTGLGAPRGPRGQYLAQFLSLCSASQMSHNSSNNACVDMSATKDANQHALVNRNSA